MRRMMILGVYRERVFSPGKIQEDAAILDATLLQLSRKGYDSHALQAESLKLGSSAPAWVLSMAQSDRVLGILEGWHKHGTVIINSVQSIRNCYRKPLIRLLQEIDLPIPRSRIVPLKVLELETMTFGTSGGYWLKRGDVHAIHSDDVVNVSSTEEMACALNHFRNQKVRDILVQEHIEGRVVKFYGVGPGEYFKAFSVSTDEKLANAGRHDSFPTKELANMVSRAAKAIGLTVYGGDAVFTSQGDVVLLDFNDWPSFSRCCQPAAEGIARYISHLINGGLNES